MATEVSLFASQLIECKALVKVCLLTFQPVPVQVYVLGFGQCWVFVEEVGHEGQVEFGAPTDDVSRGDELSAAEPLGLLQHGLGPLQVVPFLNDTQGHSLGSDTRTLHSRYHVVGEAGLDPN